MPQKTILLLGAGYDHMIAIRIAQSMGVRVVAADGDKNAPGLKIADAGVHVNIRDVSALVRIGRTYRINGVMVHATEMPQVVARVAKILGLPGLPVEIAERATNKLKRINCFVEKGVPCPAFETAKTYLEAKEKAAKIGFPCVIKPIDNSASRGVRLVQGKDEVEGACREARSFSQQTVVLIEEYIQGHDLSTEAVVVNGKIYHTAFSDRNYIATMPHFVEDGGNMPTMLSPAEIVKVKKVVEQAIHALGITWGAAKGDIIIDKAGPKVLEMASRTSGGFFCSVQTPVHNGIQILQPLIRLALGEEIDEQNLQPQYSRPSIERFVFASSHTAISARKAAQAAIAPGVRFFQLLGAEPKAAVVIATGKTKSQAITSAEYAVRICTK